MSVLGPLSRGKPIDAPHSGTGNPPPTLVMGILNVTPDSFSDGGKWESASLAVARGLEMTSQGAAIIDVGGESTRPGATRVDHAQEWQRIAPVVEGLVGHGVTVSVDTVNAETALRAVDSGAAIINDVSGGRNDPRMAGVCARAPVAMVVQHWRGFPSDISLNERYEDERYGGVVPQVIAELLEQVADVRDAGVPKESIILDPGLGFALTAKDSWAIVQAIDSFVDLGYPLLVGASRKRFLKMRYGDDRARGTLDVTRMCVRAGAWGVRVHDVAENVALIEKLGSRGWKCGGRNE